MFVATGYEGTPSSKITLKVIPNGFWILRADSVTYFGEHHTRGQIRMRMDPTNNQESIQLGAGPHETFFPQGTFRSMMIEWLNVDYEEVPAKKVIKAKAKIPTSTDTPEVDLFA